MEETSGRDPGKASREGAEVSLGQILKMPVFSNIWFLASVQISFCSPSPSAVSFRGDSFCDRDSLLEPSSCSQRLHPFGCSCYTHDFWVESHRRPYTWIYSTLRGLKAQEVGPLLPGPADQNSESSNHRKAQQGPSHPQRQREQCIQPEASKACRSASSLPLSPTAPRFYTLPSRNPTWWQFLPPLHPRSLCITNSAPSPPQLNTPPLRGLTSRRSRKGSYMTQRIHTQMRANEPSYEIRAF